MNETVLCKLVFGAIVCAALAACGRPAKTEKAENKDDADADVAGPRLNIAQRPAQKIRKREPNVQDAVDLGLAFLKKQDYLAHDRLGATALVGLTFLECDVPEDSPEVKKIAAAIRERGAEQGCPYDITPIILFLDRLHRDRTPPKEDRELIQKLALRMVAGQNKAQHLWRYQVPILDEKAENSLLEALKKKRWSPSFDGDHDLSCSQFAALGLWTARRHDVPVDASLSAAANSVRKHQEKNGSWGYQFGNGDSEPMTYCGLILLALGRAIADNNQKGPLLKDPAISKGLDFLAERFKNKSHPDLPYTLWTMERTALILNIDKIGEVDWHGWGTEQLLPAQQKRGSWDGRLDLSADTCFAMLFLVRANLFQDLTDKLQGVWLPPNRNDAAMSKGPARRERG